MNVTAPLSIPFYKGLSLIVEPGHEEHESPRVLWRPFRLSQAAMA